MNLYRKEIQDQVRWLTPVIPSLNNKRDPRTKIWEMLMLGCQGVEEEPLKMPLRTW